MNYIKRGIFMGENIYKNDNSDEVLKKIIDKLVEYDQSLRKIKSYLRRINLFVKSIPNAPP